MISRHFYIMPDIISPFLTKNVTKFCINFPVIRRFFVSQRLMCNIWCQQTRLKAWKYCRKTISMIIIKSTFENNTIRLYIQNFRESQSSLRQAGWCWRMLWECRILTPTITLTLDSKNTTWPQFEIDKPFDKMKH